MQLTSPLLNPHQCGGKKKENKKTPAHAYFHLSRKKSISEFLSSTMTLIWFKEMLLLPFTTHDCSISDSFAWMGQSSHTTHCDARFPTLSHLSLQDHYSSLVLASPLVPNKAAGGLCGAYRLMPSYTSPISHFCFTH